MKIKFLLLSILAFMSITIACNKDKDVKAPKLDLDKTELTFSKEGGKQAIVLSSTRAWKLVSDVDWITVNPSNGLAADAKEISISVLPNTGSSRKSTLVFDGMAKASLIVVQEGETSDQSVGSNTDDNSNSNTGANTEIFPTFKTTLFSINFGVGAAKSGKYWPYFNQFSGDKGISGLLSQSVVIDNWGASIRTNSHASTGYSNASGGNNLWLSESKEGADKLSYFSIAGLNVGTSTEMAISMGLSYYDFKTKENLFKPEYISLLLKEDGQNEGQKIEFDLASAGEWYLLTSKNLTVKPNTSYTVEITNTKAIRIDDILIKVNGEVSPSAPVTPTPKNPDNGNDNTDNTNNGTGDNSNDTQAESEYASTVSYSEGSGKYYDFYLNIDSKIVKCFKLGSGKGVGAANLTIPAGAKTLSFYALAWKSHATKLFVSYNGGTAKEFDIKDYPRMSGNYGMTESSAIPVTVEDSFKYEIDLSELFGDSMPSADATIVMETKDASNGRVEVFGLKTK